MKKIMAILLVLVFAFSFSTVAFATGEEKAEDNTTSEEFVYTDGASDIYDFSDVETNVTVEDMLEQTGIEMSTLVLAYVFIFSSLLFVPVLIVLIVFASKNKKVKQQIRNYEITYGVVYDKDVIKDMANIPPQNYNYNPQAFVPQYPMQGQPNAPQNNRDISAFSQALKNEAAVETSNEEKKENEGGSL